MTDDSARQTKSRFSHVCNTVVSDVAAVIGKEPEELHPPLYEVIDLEALEQLFHRPGETPRNPTGHVVFGYLGCRITVHSTGQVHVAPPEEATEASSTKSVDKLPGRGEDIPNR